MKGLAVVEKTKSGIPRLFQYWVCIVDDRS